MLEAGFREDLNMELFNQEIDSEVVKKVSRFASRDQLSLLTLAKDLICLFSDRLNVKELRKISTQKDKDKLASNKLLESVLAQKAGADRAREIFGPIVGTYDMRVGDAHPTSSKIQNAISLAQIDQDRSFLAQGEQLIKNFGYSIRVIGELLFEKPVSYTHLTLPTNREV